MAKMATSSTANDTIVPKLAKNCLFFMVKPAPKMIGGQSSSRWSRHRSRCDRELVRVTSRR